MADGGYHGNLRGKNGPDDGFFIEAPQVFEAAAAAADDQRVERRLEAIGQLDAAGDSVADALALHASGDDQNLDTMKATGGDLQKIADGSTAGAGDEAHAPGKCGQGPFARRVEQTFGFQAPQQLLKGKLQSAEALRLDLLDD